MFSLLFMVESANHIRDKYLVKEYYGNGFVLPEYHEDNKVESVIIKEGGKSVVKVAVEGANTINEDDKDICMPSSFWMNKYSFSESEIQAIVVGSNYSSGHIGSDGNFITNVEIRIIGYDSRNKRDRNLVSKLERLHKEN
jgi:hypothetical protein